MAMDEQGHGYPCCWAAVPNETAAIAQVLKTFRNIRAAVTLHRNDFKPSCFLTDACVAEQRAIEYASTPHMLEIPSYRLASFHDIACAVCLAEHIHHV